jgi:hypothetical protein
MKSIALLCLVLCAFAATASAMSPRLVAQQPSASEALALLRAHLARMHLTPVAGSQVVTASHNLTLSSPLTCSICEMAVGAVEGFLIKHGCSFLFDAVAISACEAAGLGPENPLSEVCAGLLIAGCSKIAQDLANKVTDKHVICQHLSIC